MERNFEEFEHGPVVSQSELIHVTINARGSFFLNRRAIEALGEPDFVVLMYDRRRSTIGMTRAPSTRKNAFRLKRKDRIKNNGRIIYASNFCRFYHIRPDETLAFTAPEVDKNGILVLDLNEVKSVRKI
ncbi:MAG: hypothetical protein WKF92_02415 [Pyrinomonadaceae bacterium]